MVRGATRDCGNAATQKRADDTGVEITRKVCGGQISARRSGCSSRRNRRFCDALGDALFGHLANDPAGKAADTAEQPG